MFRSVVAMIGQLMRIHLAIPDGPVEAKIRPKVQPGPAPCPLFFPEAEEPITLYPGLWILRLPYPFTSFRVTLSCLKCGDTLTVVT